MFESDGFSFAPLQGFGFGALWNIPEVTKAYSTIASCTVTVYTA